MNDDYLWDGSGEPDPKVQQFESALARFRYKGPPALFDRAGFWGRLGLRRAVSRRVALPRFAALAAVALLCTAVWIAVRWTARRTAVARVTAWEIERLDGSPQAGATGIGGTGRLAVGQWLETDAQSRAEIRAGEIGEVELEPKTRLRVLRGREGDGRLALEYGTIRAAIWAPPGRFVVDTPSAVAVDLGCIYTLHVDETGAGTLRTTLGWVGFVLKGRESFIPAGAMCATRPGFGPGTPYFEDASERLKESLNKFDFQMLAPHERSAIISSIIAECRERDAVTLWHLLSRVSEDERGRVYERLAQLVPPAREITQQGILRLDKSMLDLWWDQLGLGDISLWRHWERSWSREAR